MIVFFNMFGNLKLFVVFKIFSLVNFFLEVWMLYWNNVLIVGLYLFGNFFFSKWVIIDVFLIFFVFNILMWRFFLMMICCFLFMIDKFVFCKVWWKVNWYISFIYFYIIFFLFLIGWIYISNYDLFFNRYVLFLEIVYIIYFLLFLLFM